MQAAFGDGFFSIAAFIAKLIEATDEHHTIQHGHATERDEADGGADAEGQTAHPEGEHAASDGKRDAGVDDECLHHTFESGVDEHKDEHESKWHDDHESGASFLEMLKLPAEIDAIAVRQLHAGGDLGARRIDVSFRVGATREIDIQTDTTMPILTTNGIHLRHFNEVGQTTESDEAAILRAHGQGFHDFGIVAQIFRQTNDDGAAAIVLDQHACGVSSHRGGDGGVYFGGFDVEFEHGGTVHADLQHGHAALAFEFGIVRASDTFEDLLHLSGDLFHRVVVITKNAHGEVGTGAFEHLVKAHLDRLGEVVVLLRHFFGEFFAHEFGESITADRLAIFFAPFRLWFVENVEVVFAGRHGISCHLAGAHAGEGACHFRHFFDEILLRLDAALERGLEAGVGWLIHHRGPGTFVECWHELLLEIHEHQHGDNEKRHDATDHSPAGLPRDAQ